MISSSNQWSFFCQSLRRSTNATIAFIFRDDWPGLHDYSSVTRIFNFTCDLKVLTWKIMNHFHPWRRLWWFILVEFRILPRISNKVPPPVTKSYGNFFIRWIRYELLNVMHQSGVELLISLNNTGINFRRITFFLQDLHEKSEAAFAITAIQVLSLLHVSDFVW